MVDKLLKRCYARVYSQAVRLHYWWHFALNPEEMDDLCASLGYACDLKCEAAGGTLDCLCLNIPQTPAGYFSDTEIEYLRSRDNDPED